MLLYLARIGICKLLGHTGGYRDEVTRGYALGLIERAHKILRRTDMPPPNETFEAYDNLAVSIMRDSGMFRRKRSPAAEKIALDLPVSKWNDQAVNVLKTIMRRLPKDLGVNGLVVETEAYAVADNQYRLIEDMAILFANRNSDLAKAFPGWCNRICNTLIKVPGVLAEDLPNRSAFPRKWKQSPDELIDLIFRGTPVGEWLRMPVPITIPDKAYHCQAWGMAGVGSGKSTFTQALVIGNLGRKGMLVIDSKRGLGEDVIKHCCRPDLVTHINMTDARSRPLFNIAMPPKGMPADRAAKAIAFVLEGVGIRLTDLQMPAFEMIVRLASESGKLTVDALLKVLDDPAIAAFCAETAPDDVKRWFKTQYKTDEIQTALKQISRKLWGLASSEIKRQLFCGDRNTLDLKDLLDRKRLVIVTIDKNEIGGEAALAIRVILSALGAAMWARPPTPPKSMPDWLCFIDEFGDVDAHQGAGVVFDIITQGRQRRVGLCITHQQSKGQLPKDIHGALLGSAAIKYACNVDDTDANALSGVMNCPKGDLQAIPRDEQFGRFMLFVQSYIERAALVRIPYGFLQRRPGLSKQLLVQTYAEFRAYWARINAPPEGEGGEEPMQNFASGGNGHVGPDNRPDIDLKEEKPGDVVPYKEMKDVTDKAFRRPWAGNGDGS